MGHPRNKADRLRISRLKGYRRWRAKFGAVCPTNPDLSYEAGKVVGIHRDVYEVMKREYEFAVSYIRRAGRTAVPCSCWMCGHARKHWGKTLQEIRFEDSCES